MSQTDTDALPPHLTAEQSDRGFSFLPPIVCLWGMDPRPAGEVSVSESSAASDAYLWLRAKSVNPEGETASHLAVEDALRLADQLVHAVANHYQFGGNVLAGQLAPVAAEVREQIDEMLTILAEADEDGDKS